MNQPTISVVIPLYNHARYIEAALVSVFEQSSPPDEILLIDDGSSDDGLEIARKVTRNCRHARLLSQQNRGAHLTLNRLVKESKGGYIAVLNSDDCFLPEKLARCRDIFRENRDVGLICGKVSFMDEVGNRLTAGKSVDWLARAEAFRLRSGLPQLSLLNENFVATTSNMVFSRDLWRRCSGFQNLRYCHDLDFIMSAYKNGTVWMDDQVDHILYRVHSANTIGEDISRIRVEIASVIASALQEGGFHIFQGDLTQEKLSSFYDFLDNKGLTSMICCLQAIYRSFETKDDFYCYMANPVIASTFRSAAR